MTNWKEYKLGELLGKKGYIRGPFGSALRRTEMKSEGYAVYEQQHAIYNTRDFRYFIDENKFSELSRFSIKANDLIISCSGTVGEVSIINKDDPQGIISQALLTLRPNLDLVKPKFLYYFFKTRNGHNQLLSASHGSVQVNIAKREVVESIPVFVPDIETQDSIIEILSSLDDKIELNNKINQELENLAQTLFKQWFIDFEFPNENGEPYKSSGGEMVDNELGEIPKGWEVKSLDEIAVINLGGTPSRNKDEYWSGNIPWVNSGAINENYILNAVEFITELGLQKSSTKLIPKYSTLIAITGATLGQVSYSLIDACYNQSVISLASKKSINEFLHLLINSIIPELVKHQTGGAQQHINKGNVENFKVLIPSIELLTYFKSVVSDIYLQIEYNLRESQELTRLRDTLLPKLISGELEVNDVKF